MSDLHYTKILIETAHPQPFFHESRQRFETALASIATSTAASVSPEQLYRQLAPAIAELGDSHTNLNTYTKTYQDFRSANGRLFPLELRVVNRRAFVTANYGPERTIPVGAELSTVDGLGIPAFLDRLGRFVGAERVPLRDSFVAEDVRAYMWHAGITAPFKVGYYGSSHQAIGRTIQGATVAAIHAWDNSYAGYAALTPFRMSYLYGGAVSVLTIHNFENPDGWHDFMRRLVDDLRTHQARALLIDLRLNSGGDTVTSDALLSLLAHARFRDFSHADIKVSRITKAQYGHDRYVDIYGPDAWSASDNTVLRQPVDWTDPIAANLRFSGKTYVLEGSGTFSTAAIFAAAVQDCRVGSILGQESGGLPTLYGEAFSFALPASGLEGTVSTKFFVRPNGDPAVRGVVPDYALTASAPDAPEDPELDAAVRYAYAHS